MPNNSARNLVKYEKRVNVLYVEKDMFICRLDRPWIDTPFWLQGFFLRSDEELVALRQYCNSVYIDISRGLEAKYYMEEDLELPTSAFLEKEILKKKPTIRYQNKTTLNEELEVANLVLEKATNKYYLVMDNIKHGKTLGLKLVPNLIKPLFDCVMRNSDALVLLIQLRNKNNLGYYHGVDACVMAIVFGRFMGMPLDELNKLACGALLLDIGKLNITDNILNKLEPLSDDEYAEVCSHVEHGVEFLRKDINIEEDVINMVLAHHERSDGSGYPNGLKEHRIPAFARIAGMIDCYNAMCSQRPYNQSLTPFDSMQELYKLRKQHFQPELVEKFMHCFGVYPNGSLVEFKSGEVGMILIQNHTQRSKPIILLLFDANDVEYEKYKVIDLAKKSPSNGGGILVIHKVLKKNERNLEGAMIYTKLKLALLDSEFIELGAISEVKSKVESLFKRVFNYIFRVVK